MATLQELEEALIKADAAGNAQDAMAFANEIRRLRQVQTMPAVEVRPAPTEGMSGLDRFRAGLGKSLADTGYGLAQSALWPRVPGVINRAADSVDEAIGSPAYSRLRKDVMGLYNAPRQALERKIADRREIDEPLMNTGSGIAGNVTGALAQMLGPGFLARGTSAASVVLPTTLRGNLLQGAALGAAQPSLSDEERLTNAGVGGVGGLLGAAIPKAAGAALRSARSLLDPFTESGAAAKAARVVRASAEDPARLLVRQPSAVPGVQRTLAEETLDPGVAQLQRAVAARSGATFDSLRRSNNASRVGALRSFAGDENAIADAIKARSAASSGAREKAYAEGAEFDAAQAAARQQELVATQELAARAAAENARMSSLGLGGSIPPPAEVPATSGVDDLLSEVGQIVAARNGNLAVQPVLAGVQSSIKQGGDSFAGLINSRDYVDALLTNKAGEASKAAKSATRELMQIKGRLDEEIARRAPSFPDYLKSYQEASKPINRMQVGQELLKRGSRGQYDAATGVEVLMPAQFGRQVTGLDRIAKTATGFKKATAAGTLDPSDLAKIRNVNDDLSRQLFADDAARGAGSNTFQNFVTDGDILGAVQEMGINIPGAGIVRMLGKGGRERVNQQLVTILTDPARAQEVLKRASASDRKVIQGALTAMGGGSGTALAVGSSD